MILYIINLIKTIIGVGTIFFAYNYIDISKDFWIGIIIMGLGIFFFIWGLSFFVITGILKILSNRGRNYCAQISYKYSSLVAIFILVNFFLLSINFWSKIIGIILFGCFLALGMLI